LWAYPHEILLNGSLSLGEKMGVLKKILTIFGQKLYFLQKIMRTSKGFHKSKVKLKNNSSPPSPRDIKVCGGPHNMFLNSYPPPIPLHVIFLGPEAPYG